MERFRKILVSVDATQSDDAPQALVRATRLAKDSGAELRIVDVVQQPSFLVRKLFHGDNAAADLFQAENQQRLNIMCKRLDESGIRFSTAILRGRPFVELIREVERQGCDLLIRNASGQDENSSLFFGSVDMRLMRNCPCPVWMVKPRPVLHFERVLVAADPFPTDDDEERLNDRIVNLAASLAAWERGTLYAVGAWDVRGEAILASKMNTTAFQDHVEQICLTGRENLLRTLGAIQNPPAKSHTKYVRGDAADVITQCARAIDADVIVMGTLARTGVPGMLIGNTAERVLRATRCSVLTIKPQDFVSPVLAEVVDNANEGT